ncbi:MAG: general stress protein [Actinomycetes bacterium]
MAQKFDMNASLADPTRHPLLASYDNYLDAQAAVDKLSDEKFPVQGVSIVGVDLKMVETVLGRMSWGRAAAGGLLTGAWFGLLLGIFVSFFAKTEDMTPMTLILLGLVYGAGFGIIFGLVSYWMTGGKRDFVSRSQIRASRYDVHVDARTIGDARKILGLGVQWPPPLEADTPEVVDKE